MRKIELFLRSDKYFKFFSLFSFCFLSSLVLSSIQIQANPRDFLILGPTGTRTVGLFSVFTTVIGALDIYEREKYAGFQIDFKNHGLYYEPSHGPNWWNYYFEPIYLGKAKGRHKVYFSTFQWHGELALRTLQKLSIRRCNELIRKYIRVKSHIRSKVSDFVKKRFKDLYVIGVHYRGTDKMGYESPNLSYDEMLVEINKVVKSSHLKNYKIFVATDEQQFLDYIKLHFPNVVIHSNAIRSSNSKPIHMSKENAYQKGEDAVIDCLLLSKCDYLIRTSSNLSMCATLINPNLPVTLLNPGQYEKIDDRLKPVETSAG